MAGPLFSRKTLMGRTLWPIAGLITLVIVVAIAITTQSLYDRAVQTVEAKATLGTHAMASAAAVPVWDLSVKQASHLLRAAAPDPDFVAAQIILPDGKTFASFGSSEGSPSERTFTAPILRKTPQGETPLGQVEMIYSLAGARAQANHAALQMILAGSLLFLILIGALVLILRAVTRPIVQMTQAMEQLSRGASDTEIPPISMGDELIAMAKAMAVFKSNTVELYELMEEQKKLRLSAEKNARLSLFLKQIVATVNHVPDPENMLAIFLGTACKLFHWPIGHVYIVQNDILRTHHIWYLQNREKHGSFKQTTECSLVQSGCGLPGQACSTRHPVWVEDSRQSVNSPRLNALHPTSPFAGVALPIFVDDQVRYVIEMIADTTRPTDYDLLAALSEASTYLSWAIERQTTDPSSESAKKAQGKRLTKAPMQSVLKMLSLVLQTELTETQRNRSDVTRQSAESVISLLNDVLDLSLGENGYSVEKTKIDLYDLIETTTRLYNARAQQKGMAILLDIAPDVPQTLTNDFAALRQVLLNLLDNAVKYTAEGLVTVQVRCTGQTLEIVITDTGPGFALNQIETVWQADNGVSETDGILLGSPGLGLSVSKRLVDLMGGALTLSRCPPPRIGSTATLALALDAPHQSAPPYTLLPRPLRAHKVLLLNRYDADRSDAIWALARWGIEALIEKDQTAFVQTLKTRQDEITAILCPTNGLNAELLATLRETMSDPKKRPWLGWMQPLGYGNTIPESLRAVTAFTITPPLSQPTLYRILHYLDSCHLGAIPPTPVTLQDLRTTDETESEQPHQAPRVLVVDDQSFNLILMESLLTRYGCIADTAPDGKTAVEKVRKERYDLIFMDCQMPEMDGFATTAEIRQIESGFPTRTPIVAFTANTEYGDRETCLSFDMDDYIPKPIKSEKVLAALRTHLDLHLQDEH